MNLTRKELLKEKVQLDLLKLNFPALVSVLLKQFDEETIRKHLKKIGENMAETWLKYYTPSGSNIQKILFDNTKRTFGKLKISVIEDKEKKQFIFRYYECPLCRKDIEMVSSVPYCISISGFYERFFNKLAEINKDLGFKRIVGLTTESISSGSEYCEHLFKILE